MNNIDKRLEEVRAAMASIENRQTLIQAKIDRLNARHEELGREWLVLVGYENDLARQKAEAEKVLGQKV